MHDFMASIATCLRDWGLGKVEDFDLLKKEYASALEQLRYAQKTVAVSTGVVVLEVLPASKKPSAAAEVLLCWKMTISSQLANCHGYQISAPLGAEQKSGR